MENIRFDGSFRSGSSMNCASKGKNCDGLNYLLKIIVIA